LILGNDMKNYLKWKFKIEKIIWNKKGVGYFWIKKNLLI
jgi:hypothetical protein